MSLLVPCSSCGSKEPGKLANVTWAWWLADGERTAWRQHLCLACYAAQAVVLHVSVRADPLSCPVCHTDPLEAMDPTYMTSFIPGVGKIQLEMATCGPCAVTVRSRGQVNARKLDGRPPASGGSEPGPQMDDVAAAWRALGIDPHE